MQQPLSRVEVFDNTYRTLLRRWTELGKQQSRTWREQQEFEAADRFLAAREVGTVRALVSDYEEMLRNANHLGEVEL